MRRIALYARVSTDEQTTAPQVDALVEYAQRRGLEHELFSDEGVSGSRDRRPELDSLLAGIRRREFDAVALTKLDRIGRSVRHLTELAGEFEALGVDLIVLDQGIDTSTPAGRLLFHVLASIAEFERDLIRDRTRAGIEAARKRGVVCHRPRTARTPENVARARRMRAAGQSMKAIAGVLECSVGSVHRMLSAR